MPVEIVCEVCGSTKQVKAYKAATARFCSHACRLQSLHEKLREDRPKAEHVCAQCGEAYRRSPSGAGKYCSRDCYDIAQKNTAAVVFTRVDQSGGVDACWPWTGPVTKWGYGRATRAHRTHNAHRLAYEATHGPVATGQVVMHTCDNRLCCNPAHLKAGTQRENMIDMHSKGRSRHQKAAH
jgi:endogenous inhibitor of DNA gyrase (YacG/DUF329 family)